MHKFSPRRIAATLYPFFLLTLSAQQLQEKSTPTVGPRLVRFAGSLPASANTPAGALVGATFGIYKDEQGGTPLWTETQNVEPAADGKYSVLLGATTDEGIPASVFASGESRWLQAEYQIVGQTPPPRVLLVSVPYALKAADADTIGGKPLSAFVLAGESNGKGSDGLNYLNTEALKGRKFSSSPGATSGSAGYLGMFTNSTDLVNSTVFQSGSSIGIGTINPGNWWSKLEVVDNSTNASPRISVGASDTGGGVSGFQFLSGPVWKGGMYRVHASDDLQLYTAGDGGNPRVTFKNGGNVGIGTTSPGNWWSKLEVVDNGANASPRISVGASGTGGGLSGFQFLSGAGWKGGLYRVHANDDLQLYTAGDGGNPRVTFKSGGNVGIGTTAPAAKLHVFGNALMDGNLTVSGNIMLPGTLGPLIQSPNDGRYNFAAGLGAMPVVTSYGFNTAVGNNALHANSDGHYNTALGTNALAANIGGVSNTALGAGALQANTAGQYNTAVGEYTLPTNKTGNFNTALGAEALSSNLGSENTAVGLGALSGNGPGGRNTAVGVYALAQNGAGEQVDSGSRNTAVGFEAAKWNNTAWNNTAVGYSALTGGFNTSGSNNTAVGSEALLSIYSGSYNAALGSFSLHANSSGGDNTAVGDGALYSNTSGSSNTAVGSSALRLNTGGASNTAIGWVALYNNSGTGNTALGYLAGANLTTGSNNINLGIGTNASAGESATIRIGGSGLQTRAFIAGISGVTTGLSGAVNVVIDSNGQLGTVSSSRRYKENIHDMGDTSSSLLRLRPVTYNYKTPYADGSKPLDYGLIAEEVEEVYPDLVAKSANGQVETVQYHKLIPMLVNELQKQNAKLQEQNREIGGLRQRLGELESAMESLSGRK